MTERTRELECVIADLTLEAKELCAELETLKNQVPVAYKHRDGMLSKRLPGGPVLGIDWTPLYAAPVPQAQSVPDEWQLVPKVPTQEMVRACATIPAPSGQGGYQPVRDGGPTQPPRRP